MSEKKNGYSTDIYRLNKRFSEFENYFDLEGSPGYNMLPENNAVLNKS